MVAENRKNALECGFGQIFNVKCSLWIVQWNLNQLPKTMPKRPENNLPKPRKVNGSLLAIYVDKKRIVFGNYNDLAAWKKYSEFCEKRQNGESEAPAPVAPLAGGHSPTGSFSPSDSSPPGGSNAALVADLVTQFLEAAQTTKNPSDFGNYKKAGQSLWPYRHLPTAEFDAFLLLKVQKS